MGVLLPELRGGDRSSGFPTHTHVGVVPIAGEDEGEGGEAPDGDPVAPRAEPEEPLPLCLVHRGPTPRGPSGQRPKGAGGDEHNSTGSATSCWTPFEKDQKKGLISPNQSPVVVKLSLYIRSIFRSDESRRCSSQVLRRPVRAPLPRSSGRWGSPS